MACKRQCEREMPDVGAASRVAGSARVMMERVRFCGWDEGEVLCRVCWRRSGGSARVLYLKGREREVMGAGLVMDLC
ncbi:hypothetical protein AAC387_Pa04g1337 [Persea americana]